LTRPTFDKRLAIAKQLKVDGFILEINGEVSVVASLASGVAHGSSSAQIVGATDDPRWEYNGIIARGSRRTSGLYHIIRGNVKFSRFCHIMAAVLHPIGHGFTPRHVPQARSVEVGSTSMPGGNSVAR
jgi:hypothetical protein